VQYRKPARPVQTLRSRRWQRQPRTCLGGVRSCGDHQSFIAEKLWTPLALAGITGDCNAGVSRWLAASPSPVPYRIGAAT
jgi:hypothetical protein